MALTSGAVLDEDGRALVERAGHRRGWVYELGRGAIRFTAAAKDLREAIEHCDLRLIGRALGRGFGDRLGIQSIATRTRE